MNSYLNVCALLVVFVSLVASKPTSGEVDARPEASGDNNGDVSHSGMSPLDETMASEQVTKLVLYCHGPAPRRYL